MARRGPLSAAKRKREAEKREKRQAKMEKRARRAEEKAQAREAGESAVPIQDATEYGIPVRTLEGFERRPGGE